MFREQGEYGAKLFIGGGMGFFALGLAIFCFVAAWMEPQYPFVAMPLMAGCLMGFCGLMSLWMAFTAATGKNGWGAVFSPRGEFTGKLIPPGKRVWTGIRCRIFDVTKSDFQQEILQDATLADGKKVKMVVRASSEFDPDKLADLLTTHGLELPKAPMLAAIREKLPATLAKTSMATLLDDLPALESEVQIAVSEALEPGGLVGVRVELRGVDFKS